jgi:BirA family biotin operon repressor/biotin-[acetyl-CoA-carboxylase] ligase
LGVAVHDAVQSDAVWLKWPNDLLDGEDGKVAGVLAEAEMSGGCVDHVVAGVGINVTSAPTEVVGASSLRRVGVRLGRAEVAVRLVSSIMTWVHRLEHEPRAVVVAWRQRSRLWGREVRVGNVHGIADSLDEDGALWLRGASGTRRRVLAGDVEMIKVEHR